MFVSRRRTSLSCLVLATVMCACTGCGDEEGGERSEPPQPVIDTTIQIDAPQPAMKPAGRLPHFTDVTLSSGIGFQRFDDQRGLHRIQEANGGGVALFDFDGDGMLDVFLTNGCRLPVSESDEDTPSRLFRNHGDCRFKDVTSGSLIESGYTYGCAVGDFNNDGFDDLYLTAFGQNSLWENNGDGTFSDITQSSGVSDLSWGSSVAFADLDRDADLDLYVTNYVDSSVEVPQVCPNPDAPDGRIQCSPTVFAAASDSVFSNNGDGTFENITIESGARGVDGKGLGVAVFDFNRDGWPDIYVANDGTPNFLFRNTGTLNADGVIQFEECASLSGAAISFDGKAESSMGVAVADLTADGYPEIVLTHFFAETNTLYLNEGGEYFSDSTNETGLGPTSRDRVGFGTLPIDFDSNGVLDLFMTNGHVDDFSFAGEAYFQRPQFFRNDGTGHFTDVSVWSGPFFEKKWIGRGVASGDLDEDGDIDLVISHQRSPSVVLRNDTDTPHNSVILNLIGGPASSRSAIGALIQTQGMTSDVTREVIGGGSYQSACSRRVHIGLGEDSVIPSLTVTWPSGTLQTLSAVTPGAWHLIEGQALTAARR